MSPTDVYYLPETAKPKLEGLVDRIVARPGAFLDLNTLKEASAELDLKRVIPTLPETITEEDFVGILKLAMLTECATDAYAAVFTEGASQYDAPWLNRFNQLVWVPDEHTHYTPYKWMLQTLGYSEEELDREVREVRGRHYDHCCGTTPVELTTYGLIQEYLTDHWHGLIGQLLKPSAPYAAQCAHAIKRRETLHTVWYRDMTAIQVEENPEMLGLVAETMRRFVMPGTTLVPEYGNKTMDWMARANVDYSHMGKELVRNFSEVAGTVRKTGELFLEATIRRGYKLGPFPPKLVRTVMNRLGGPGYGLIGEAILDKVGLPYPKSTGVTGRIRDSLRNFIMDRMDLRTVTGKTAGT